MGHEDAARVAAVRRRSIAVCALVLAVLGGCGDDPPATPAPDPAEIARRAEARARAAAHFASEEYDKAAGQVERLLEREPVPAEDHVRAGIVADWLGEPGSFDRARTHFRRALELEPDLAAAHYVLGVLLQRGQEEQALRHMERAHALAPGDYPTTLQLAHLYTLLDRPDHAARLYERLESLGPNQAGSWHLVTLYGLAQVRMRQDRREEALALLEEYKRLRARALEPPGPDRIRQGNFGRLSAPPPPGATTPAPVAPAWEKAGALEALAGFEHVRALTLVDDWTHRDDTCFVAPPDLVAFGTGGLVVAAHGDAGHGAPERIHAGPVAALAAGDLDQDGRLDLVFATPDGVELRLGAAEGWRTPAFAVPALPGPPADVEPVDYDHDGDLDLLWVGAFGARLWRNDGVSEGGVLVEAGPDSGLPAQTPLAWARSEDFDTDQDVDFLIGGPEQPTLLADNLRGGRFRTVETGIGSQALAPLTADLDADARPDLVTNEGRLVVRRGRVAGGFAPPQRLDRGAVDARVVDVDLDGVPDVVGRAPDGGAAGVLAAGSERPVSFSADLPGAAGTGAFVHADLDGDRRLELLRPAPGALERFRPSRPAGGAFLLALRGTKDNRRGVGAVVEIRAGPHYQRLYWRGEPTLIGLGGQPKADVTRITWPNGIVQFDLDTPAGCARLIEQAEGLVGSCPFLYSFDGERYVFVTDVLGITPLGLPMAPGQLVPPDHDEYVLVRGEQLAPRTLEDGSEVFELQLTEELREVTYLDRTALIAVDHPAGTEVQPNERFSFPPFPEPHVHVARPFAPLRATGSDGRDWTKALARDDADYAAPFEPLGGQWLGLAPRHWVEVAFDPERVPPAGRLRLFLTGWFYWTDASVNVAAARTPGVAFEPPVLLVPPQAGGNGPEPAWRAVGPPVGFPAGKRKTMVLDVTDVLDRDDPRLRIATTLRLYWDAARLAVGEDAPSRQQTLEPTSARLWERGFSKPIPTFGRHALDWFDWDVMDAPRWNPHPGMYTRLGEVRPLVTAIDDRFVVMASGDALRLRFAADDVEPPPPGWRRDFLLFVDGWAKDRDPNTLEAEFVEPLPFHGMSGYPYGPDERYPDDAAHRRYREAWNTRVPRTWVRSLRPAKAPPVVR